MSTITPTTAAPPLVTPRTETAEARAVVMIVDDEPLNVTVVRKFLQRAGYQRFEEVTDSREAIARIYSQAPDVLLLDLMMPGVSGLEILETLRSDPQMDNLPVLILTASSNRDTRAEALNLGATDFLSKPVDPVELAPRVRNALLVKQRGDWLEHLVQHRTIEVERSRQEVIHCLARAAEFRDNETGRHVIRVGKYTGLIARQLGYNDSDAQQLNLAATLHDVGKIGIPDAILLKPGKLSPDEFEVMKKHSAFGKHIVSPMEGDDQRTFAGHAELGAQIMGECSSPILRLAARIAISHHEKWDGSGYPEGLSGTDIPIEGRIVAVADVFDALSSRRPYKPPFPVERCLEILEEGRGKHFDPQVLDAFRAVQSDVLRVQSEYTDEVESDDDI